MVDKLYRTSDEDFCRIIKTNTTWKGVNEALGYSSRAFKIHKKILERCKALGVELNLEYNSPILNMTKGELFGCRKNWQSARTAIRKLADSIFKRSNKPRECAICGYNKHIEIAHIKGVSEFSDDSLVSEINDINNLVALCPNHHWEFDSGQLSEEDKRKISQGGSSGSSCGS